MKRLMIYSKHGSFYPSAIVGILHNNSNYILLFTLFTCGILTGSVIVSSAAVDSQFYSLLSAVFSPQNITASKIVLNFSCSSLLYILLSFCAGLCCVGFPLIYILPTVRGLYYGMMSAYMLEIYAYKGFGCFALIFVPGAVISLCACFYACNTASLMTKKLAVNTFLGGTQDTDIKMYMIKFALMAAIQGGGALISFLCYKLFYKMFIF